MSIHHTAIVGRVPEHRDFLRSPDKEFFPAIVDESVVVQPYVTIDGGVLRETRVREGTLLLAKSHIGHDAQIGRNCEIGTGAIIGGHCILADNVKIGLNSVVRPGVTIEANARLGAGSVVVDDIPAGELWVGNPARFLRMNNA